MGFKLAGFAIDKNYENKIDELSKALFESEKYHLLAEAHSYHLEVV